METKEVSLTLKSFDDDSGRFEGLAAVYGNKDLGDDVILPGAFTNTINLNKNGFPLFYGHKVNVGTAFVKDAEAGIVTEGKFNLAKQVSRDVYSDLKFYKENGLNFGMSIGYTIPENKFEYRGETRFIREVRLFEVTLTEFPMNPLARVQTVKSAEDVEERVAALMREIKAGRAISKERAMKLRAMAEQILALLSEAGYDDDIEPTSGKAAAPPPEPAGGHSAVSSRIEEIRALLN